MPSKIQSAGKSIKHEIIDKANNNMLVAVALATFIFIFCAFGAKALISQSLYHGRVIGEKETALKQLEDNKQSLVELQKSFIAFQSETINILGGNPSGEGPLDGDNAKLVLDALPGTYDYPALSSSFEKILRDGGYDIGSIGGTEDPTLALDGSTASGTALPVDVPYSFSVSSNTDGTRRLLETLENSIRPMNIDNLQIQIGESVLQTRLSLRTFFTQPKTFELGSKEVK